MLWMPTLAFGITGVFMKFLTVNEIRFQLKEIMRNYDITWLALLDLHAVSLVVLTH